MGYITKYPGADRLTLVRIPCTALFDTFTSSQISDVAEGLNFLHSCNVIYRDLKEVRGYPRSCFAVVLTAPS